MIAKQIYDSISGIEFKKENDKLYCKVSHNTANWFQAYEVIREGVSGYEIQLDCCLRRYISYYHSENNISLKDSEKLFILNDLKALIRHDI